MWALAILNAPVGWWYAWRGAQHAKDEALRYFSTFVDAYPIPLPSSKAEASAAELISSLSNASKSVDQARRGLADWYQHTMEISKANRSLLNPFDMHIDDFINQIANQRGKRNPLSSVALRSIREEYANTVRPVQLKVRETEQLERCLNDLVNEAYGLTPDEVRLMWNTAPPRMPLTNERGSQIEEAAA